MYCKALIQPDMQPVWYEGEKYFCESSKDSDLPFDPFAASFFLVTRYEEYLGTKRGKYNRYPGSESILSKYNLLKKPVVNIWANLLADKLKQRFPAFGFFLNENFSFFQPLILTMPGLFCIKDFIRTWGCTCKSRL